MVLFGLAFIFYFGTPDRAVTLVPLSNFETAPAAAEAILLNSGKDFENSKILLIGYQPEKPHQIEVARELLKNKKPDVLVFESNLDLSNEYPGSEKLIFSERIEILAKGLRDAVAQGRTVVLVAPSVYSAGIISGSVADLLRNRHALPVHSLTMAEFPKSRAEEKNMSIACLMKDADQTGTGALGCAMLQAGRAHYQKKMQPGSQVALTGLLEVRSPGDFYFFVN